MKAYLVLIVAIFSLQDSNAQVAEKVISQFSILENITYKAAQREKDIFSDNISLDTIKTIASINKGDIKSFKTESANYAEIFDGSKLFRLNLTDSSYGVSKNTDNSVYFYRSLPYFISELKESVKKNKPIVQLPDTIINGKYYYQLYIKNSDTVKNNQRVFNHVTMLVDKKSYLPYYYKSDVQGFIDGTNTFVATFFEHYFSDYVVNSKAFPDLSLTQLSIRFSLEKPKEKVPLLNNGTKAPELELSYADGRAFDLEKERGKVILLNFTINGCPHCVESIESLNRLFVKYNKETLLIVSINPLDTQESISKFNSKFNIKYPGFINSFKSGSNVDRYHVEAYPTFYLIDKNGYIAKGFSGFYPSLEQELVTAIDSLISL